MTAVLPAEARILVVIVARIGDSLLATPVLRALKAALPRCRVTCWAHPKRAEVFENLNDIDRLERLTKNGARWRGHLPGKPYDAALVFGHDMPLLAAAARLARRVAAFARGDAHMPPEVIPVIEPEGIHAVDHRLALLRPFGISPAGRRLLWQVSAAEASWAEAWLDRHLPAWRTGPLLGIQAASFPTKDYRDWPPGHFHELLARFIAMHPQGHAVLLGDAAGAGQARSIAAAAPARAAVLAGQATLRQSAAVMARCSAYVGVDTGPSHIAGALGLPMVVLYHPLHPGRNLMPLEHPAPLEAIEHPALAAPAARAQAAMAEIPVATVWQALLRVLPQ